MPLQRKGRLRCNHRLCLRLSQWSVQLRITSRAWLLMLQAGIALGLAQSVAARFPTWGPDFAALWAGVVMMNLLTGPPLFKVTWSLPLASVDLGRTLAVIIACVAAQGGIASSAPPCPSPLLPLACPKPIERRLRRQFLPATILPLSGGNHCVRGGAAARRQARRAADWRRRARGRRAIGATRRVRACHTHYQRMN